MYTIHLKLYGLTFFLFLAWQIENTCSAKTQIKDYSPSQSIHASAFNGFVEFVIKQTCNTGISNVNKIVILYLFRVIIFCKRKTNLVL